MMEQKIEQSEEPGSTKEESSECTDIREWIYDIDNNYEFNLIHAREFFYFFFSNKLSTNYLQILCTTIFKSF